MSRFKPSEGAADVISRCEIRFAFAGHRGFKMWARTKRATPPISPAPPKNVREVREECDFDGEMVR